MSRRGTSRQNDSYGEEYFSEAPKIAKKQSSTQSKSRYYSEKKTVYRPSPQSNQWKKPEDDSDLFWLLAILSQEDVWNALKNLTNTIVPLNGGLGSQIIKQKVDQRKLTKVELIVMGLTYPQSRQILFDILKDTPAKGSQGEMMIPSNALLGDYYIQVFPEGEKYSGDIPYTVELAEDFLVPPITEESANNPDLAPFLLDSEEDYPEKKSQKDSGFSKKITKIQKQIAQAVLDSDYASVDPERLDLIGQIVKKLLENDNDVIARVVEVFDELDLS